MLTPDLSGPLLNDVDMDVYEIRKANLLFLEAEAKSLKAIGDAMIRKVQESDPGERAPDYPNVLSQHKGKKPIGFKMARLIEDAMGKGKGWMDQLQTGQIEQAMEAKEAGQIAMNIEEADKREAWLSMGRALAKKKGPGNPYLDVPKGGKGGPKGGSGGTQ